MHHPQDCTTDVEYSFCGGGVRTVGFDVRSGTASEIATKSPVDLPGSRVEIATAIAVNHIAGIQHR